MIIENRNQLRRMARKKNLYIGAVAPDEIFNVRISIREAEEKCLRIAKKKGYILCGYDDEEDDGIVLVIEESDYISESVLEGV